MKKINKKHLTILFVLLLIFVVQLFYLKEIKKLENESKFSIDLVKECYKEGVDYNCCMDSIKAMGYSILPNKEGNCPEGFLKKNLNCPGSLSWCEMILDY